MRKSILFLMLSVNAASAQTYNDRGQLMLEVKHEKDSRGNIVFSCRNNGLSDYVLTITFHELENVETNIGQVFRKTVAPGENTLFTLTPHGGSPRFSYHTNWLRGCLEARTDTGFTYLLPVRPGTVTQVFELTNVGERFGEAPPKDWYGLGFRMNTGDTVYTARRGTVVSVRDTAQSSAAPGTVVYTANNNTVEIAHQDCSFAVYKDFRAGSIFVKPGDHVEAGDPIGLVGGEAYTSGPHLKFSVHYLYEQPVVRNGEKTDRMNYSAFVPVQFCTADAAKARLVNRSAYTAVRPENVVTAEMSKREARKWKERQGK